MGTTIFHYRMALLDQECPINFDQGCQPAPTVNKAYIAPIWPKTLRKPTDTTLLSQGVALSRDRVNQNVMTVIQLFSGNMAI